MITTIKCKSCGEEIEISEALQHQIEEQILVNERSKHQKELEKIKGQVREEVLQKSKKDFEFQIQSLQKGREEEEKRNAKLLKQSVDLSEELRKLRHKDEERELEMKKRIAKEEERIRGEAREKVLEEHESKDREKDKKLQDALKQIDALKAQIQRGSQQTQGEVMELVLEKILKGEFPQDEIFEVKKGQRGADVVQTVVDENGKNCGKILWESKNAQWNKAWLAKLRQDRRDAKADIAVLVATNPPQEIDTFAFTEGVWITKMNVVRNLTVALRHNLISIHNERANADGKDDKKEVLYQYLTSVEFKLRVEGIVEAFNNLQQDIEKEKRWFNTKWARQETEIRKIVDNTQGMYGDLQAATGRALSPIEALELPAGDVAEENGDDDDTIRVNH